MCIRDSVYKAPFDESTKDDMNAWVKEQTNGIIEQLLDEAPPANAVVYLINALSFDAESVSYTHLDVYKRQLLNGSLYCIFNTTTARYFHAHNSDTLNVVFFDDSS